jgi:hypothetical protein
VPGVPAAVTPLPGKAEIAALATANKAAAQRVAQANGARDFVLLETRFLNIANGAIPV